MASTGKCPFCGAAVRSDERACPQCGAANEQYVPFTEKTIFLPKTIEELKEYCAQRGMPLLRMRFFIGENYRKPKAFGIYRDGDRFVVYKNKASGERSIRYNGPDEAYAVNELFMKLLQECHNRGIYPDGKTEENSGTSKRGKRFRVKSPWTIPAVFLAIMCGTMLAYSVFSSHTHRQDGYYRLPGKQTIAYRYGSDWYVYNDRLHDWYQDHHLQYEPAEDDYLGKDFESNWGKSDFKSSAAWKEIKESHSSSSSDYDSWDSSDTDWDSDW